MKYLFVCSCMCAFAQENLGELVPDRPGFTSPSGVVGLGVLQIEQGYTFKSAQQDGSGIKTLSGPQTLFRFGLTKTLEVRFATDGYSWQSLRSRGENSSISGLSDSAFSAKVKIVSQTSLRPELAIIGGFSLPARGSVFTTSGYDPLFSLAAVKDLPHKFSVAANGNIASITEVNGRYRSLGQSLWASHPVGPMSVFAEIFHTTISRLDGCTTAVDAGLYRGIGKNVQVDMAVGHTVAGNRPSWFTSVGFVFRDPSRLMHRQFHRE